MNPNIPLLGEATITRISSKEFNPKMPHTLAYSGSRGVSVIDGQLHPGLHIDWNSSPIPVIWKRLRRCLQTTYVHTFNAPKKIQYIEASPLWDGIANISREYLQTFDIAALNPQQHDQLKHDLNHIQRVEITAMCDKGQYKGHAIVRNACDMGGYDLIIDNKPKKEVSFDGWFMSIKMVHGSNNPTLGTIDLQSIINHPEILASEVERAEIARHNYVIDGLRDGSIIRQWPNITPKGLDNWPALFACFAGAKPMWFPHLVKSIGGSYVVHAKAFNEKMRFPLFMYQAYLTSATGAAVSGLLDNESILDLDKASLIVSDMDYEKIAGILGGADQDDRCNIAVLQEPGDVPRIMVWRSPNNWGEYIIIDKCNIVLHGVTLCNTVLQEKAIAIDYSKLPLRIDNQIRPILDIIPDSNTNYMGDVYDPRKMYKALEDERANTGVLGTVVNYLMIIALLYGDDVLKIACVNLEKLIDAAIKTGADLKPTKEWIANQFKLLSELPLALANRVRDDVPRQLRASRLDRIAVMDREYIVHLEQAIETLGHQCQPPVELIEYGVQFEEVGHRYRTLYATTLQSQGVESARIACEAFLHENKPHEVLAGAAWYGLIHEHDASWNDACMWVNGEKLAVGRMRGVGHMMVALLQQLGLISEPVIHEGRVLWYNSPDKQVVTSFLLNGCFMNVYKKTAIANKIQDMYVKMGDMPVEERAFWKSVVHDAARITVDNLTPGGYMRGMIGRKLELVRQGNRIVAMTNGMLLGYVAKQHEELVEGLSEIVVTLAGADDGNLQIITQR